MSHPMANADNANNATISVLPYILLFFLSMVFHELALESISTIYSVPPYNFPHLATAITLFQFGFCVMLPVLMEVLPRLLLRLRSSFGSNSRDELSKDRVVGGDVFENFPKTLGQLLIYVRLSAVVYGATALATMSLGYEGVTYVTKVVFKSAKLIPTMVVGVIMDSRLDSGSAPDKRKRKRYGVWEYGSALLLCLGAAGFCLSPGELSGDSNPESGSDEGSSKSDAVGSERGGHWIGIALLTASVFCDALVPNIQEQLMHGTSTAGSSSIVNIMSPKNKSEESDEEMEMKSLINNSNDAGQLGSSRNQQSNESNEQVPTKKQQGLSSSSLMLNTNAIGFTLLFLSTIVSANLITILSFLAVNPHFLMLLTIVGIGLSSAVFSYTEIIRRSGPAVAVAVATLRKVVTVILSYVIFPKAMSGVHVASGILVLGGIAVGFIGKGRR